MSEVDRDEMRVMGEKSISKTFKGILRISHILELVQNEEDKLFNPTYYSRPKSLMNISGGNYESLEKGYHNPLAGMDGTITRYSSSNPNINDDELKANRVPMCDSMGNFLNWHVGLDGVTIGSEEQINSHHIDLEKFTQNDVIASKKISNDFIWQEKYFPVLESGEIIIGLQNKEYPQSNKYRINKVSSLTLQNSVNPAKLIIENKYDKSNIDKEITIKTKTFINYKPDENYNYRTIFQDNKSNVEKYDVFMYRQNDYDVHNYDYKLEGATEDEKYVRGNETLLSKYDFDENPASPIKTTIDANVGMVNLKEYVFDMVQKYMNSAIVEVPTGTIINQYCSLDKWYAYPDYGTVDDLVSESSYPGHRPAMMAKRDVGMMASDNEGDSSSSANNKFIQSTIMGACKKINRLINANYDYDNHETSSNQAGTENFENNSEANYTVEGYHKEIIPLYKRDYVLCDGSMYAIFLFPKNFATDSYPNRRESVDRFLDLFFAIGYQYTVNKESVNKRFKFEWIEKEGVYKIIRATATEEDATNNVHYIDASNCLKLFDDYGNVGIGTPKVDNYPYFFGEDRHAAFVEDMLTILAFETLYEKYSNGGLVADNKEWNKKNIQDWFKTVSLPEKYRLTSFLGELNSSIEEEKYTDKTEGQKSFELAKKEEFVMELPYYNFKYNHNGGKDEYFHGDRPIPVIALGREIRNFGDPIKFWDSSINKWVIVEAYKIPQIQHLLDIFAAYPSPDALAQILNTYYKYNFQVPNLMSNVPMYIGSSGIQWADSQYNRLRTTESWTSSYSQKNYMHRHFIFREPDGAPDVSSIESVINKSQALKPDKLDSYAIGGNVTYNDCVAAAACRGGYVICECSPPITITFEFGKDDNPNYIWNELGAGDNKASNITIKNESQVVNGMRYPILQTEDDTSTYHSWPTGDYRKKEDINTDDFKQVADEAITIGGTDTDIKINLSDEIWNRDDITDFGGDFISKKLEYDKEHWYGWEHYEDPRFDSLEPNRGRTSGPTNSSEIKSSSTIRYVVNSNNYNVSKTMTNAEWFSPENVKMLPLIKL